MTFRILKTCAIGAALALGGCLVSNEPLLDASNGRATPLDVGDYIMCPLGEDADEADCERMTVSVNDAGLYLISEADGDEPAHMRFRRVARKGYAIQSKEGEESYQYYYGRGDSKEFRMTMMLCQALHEDLRNSLIRNGDLASDDSDFETCAVNTVRGLDAAAKAYHRGHVDDEEEIALLFTPAPPAIQDEE